MRAPERQPALFAPPTPQAALAYAEVAIPYAVHGTFSYAVPRALIEQVGVGMRVAVQFRRERVVGYVVAMHSAPPAGVDRAKIRDVLAVLDPEPVFPPELMRLLHEAAEYYLHPLGEVLRTAAPAVDRRARDTMASSDGSGRAGHRARWAKVREETFVRLAPAVLDAPPAMRGGRPAQLVAILDARGEVSLSELRGQMKDARAVVTALVKKGIVAIERREVAADPFFGEPVPRDTPPALTDEQQRATARIVEAVSTGQRQSFLLHGVTGSGKTEVYLRAIEATQRAGRGALILLPEIALTPQIVARYRARFGDDVAVLHSGLKENDRFAMWRKLRAGESSVAIGARSAIFAPVRALGLIIVDEEHDGSFKQDEKFRYHGRDLALLRAHRAGVVCVLGSATPSIESYHAALEGRHELLVLRHRATAAPLPSIEVVDLRKLGKRGPAGHQLLTRELRRALDETLSRNEQAIVFLNRRGFAPSVRCQACGAALECPACSVALVLHRREGALKCHYCDFTAPFVSACLTCGSGDVVLVGAGTEKIEHALVEAFPRARIGRLDRDVASAAGAEVVLERLRRGEIDVLVGTQMVTKGHDIARVTLVGVVAADGALVFPDFRASERTFQLLAQVAGRAGRKDLPGRVIIQTYQPEHAAVRHARQHDYEGFYAEEIEERRALGYPPFGRLAAVKLDSLDEARVKSASEALAEWLRHVPDVAAGGVKILGPAAPPIERVRSRHRMHLMLRARERPALRRVLAALSSHLEHDGASGVRVAIDVDPTQMT